MIRRFPLYTVLFDRAARWGKMPLRQARLLAAQMLHVRPFLLRTIHFIFDHIAVCQAMIASSTWQSLAWLNTPSCTASLAPCRIAAVGVTSYEHLYVGITLLPVCGDHFTLPHHRPRSRLCVYGRTRQRLPRLREPLSLVSRVACLAVLLLCLCPLHHMDMELRWSHYPLH